MGVRLLRAMVRACDIETLVTRARHAVGHLVDDVAAVARNDRGPEGQRERAAEFIVRLRARPARVATVAEVIDRVAEAAARAGYRSNRIIDFLSIWLFIAGEQFIADVASAATAIELEAVHLEIWQQARSNILETLEAGSERIRSGRRLRLAENYLARFRLVRARQSEKTRMAAPTQLSADSIRGGDAGQHTDFVAAIVTDLFALSLSDLQQRLIVSQIPNKARTGRSPGFGASDYARLWAPLRGARTDQAREHWTRLRKDLSLRRPRAIQTFLKGLDVHLTRTWNWFFPDRAPFGLLRAALRDLEFAQEEEMDDTAEEELVGRLFRSYGAALAFIARLATEDAECSALHLDDETSAEDMF